MPSHPQAAAGLIVLKKKDVEVSPWNVAKDRVEGGRQDRMVVVVGAIAMTDKGSDVSIRGWATEIHMLVGFLCADSG